MTVTYNASNYSYDSALLTYDGGPAQSTTFPIPGVFIAFTDGPYIANPSWTEITPYVRSISTSRGRADDLEDFAAGTAQLILDNRDRRFDPFYTTGPYYQKLTPRRQIRIVGQANGVNYEVFRGYVAGWPVQWSEAGYDSTVTIQCFDALGLMANEVVTTDWVGEYTKSLNPVHYWRCDESQGTQSLSDQYSTYKMTTSSTSFPYLFEQPPVAQGIQANSTYLAAYSYGGFREIVLPNTSVDFGCAFWAIFNGGSYSSSSFRFRYGDGQVAVWLFHRAQGIYNTGDILVEWASSAAAFTYAVTQRFTSAQPVHIALNFQASTQNVTIYVNGVDITGAKTAVGTRYALPGSDEVQVFGLTIQELSQYNRILTATEVANLFNWGSARITETTAARMERLRATTDYPAALTSFTASPVASVSEIGSGAGVIQEMQLTTNSEGGEFYVSKAGVLTMTPRFGNFSGRSATPQATITDSGAGLKYGPELLIEYDADSLKNDITVTYSGDGEANVFTDANITEYGGAGTTIETYLVDSAAATALATARAGVYGALVPRISPIDVSVNTAAADWQTILGLELLDRVTFKRTPSVGNAFERDALIQGIDHQIEPGVWRTQLTLSMRYTSPLIVEDPVRGRVDFNYCG